MTPWLGSASSSGRYSGSSVRPTGLDAANPSCPRRRATRCRGRRRPTRSSSRSAPTAPSAAVSPDSPISRGRLCPKGSASERRVNNPSRQTEVLYRAPKGRDWQKLDLSTAIDMIADRFIEARRNHWEDVDDKGHPLRRTMGIASLGGATIDNEENYFAKKNFTTAGAIQIENQARI